MLLGESHGTMVVYVCDSATPCGWFVKPTRKRYARVNPFYVIRGGKPNSVGYHQCIKWIETMLQHNATCIS